MSRPTPGGGRPRERAVPSPPPGEPVRTCVGCRARRPQSELVRVVLRADDGTLAVGRTIPGRGAWLCSTGCLDRAVKRKALGRALRTEVSRAATEALRDAVEACARLKGRSESELEGK